MDVTNEFDDDVEKTPEVEDDDDKDDEDSEDEE